MNATEDRPTGPPSTPSPVGAGSVRRRRWLRRATIAALVAGLGGLTFWLTKGGGASPLSRARAAYVRGDWHSAETHARSALKINSSDRVALRMLARTAARQGNDPSAEAIYRRLGTAPLEAEDYFLLGRGL